MPFGFAPSEEAKRVAGVWPDARGDGGGFSGEFAFGLPPRTGGAFSPRCHLGHLICLQIRMRIRS
jgi:hypothetical protein